MSLSIFSGRRGANVRSNSLGKNKKRLIQAVMETAEQRVLLSSASYTLTTPWTFDNGVGGANPLANLVADNSGNLYGTTTSVSGDSFKGGIFEIPAGTTNLVSLGTFSFNGGNGLPSMSPLVYDGNGHLFGTTNEGGDNGEGSVYEVDLTQATPAVTTIASFDPDDSAVEGGNQGLNPQGRLALDPSGNLYGATVSGGGDSTNGTIYEIADPSGVSPSIQTLAAFDDTNTGYGPDSGVVYYNGVLYGATNHGPNNNGDEIYNYNIGTQTLSEQVDTASDELVDGDINGVIVDSSGNLFFSSQSGSFASEDGSIFEVAPGSSSYTTLATLTGNGGPDEPVGPLTIGPDGNIYGTTVHGGTTGDGTVFEMDANTHVVTALASFDNSTTGSESNGGLVFVGNNAFGTASSGGADHDGTVFELTAAGPPAKLVFIDQPTSQVANNSLNNDVTLAIEDASGNIITNDTSTVTIGVATPAGSAFGTDSHTSVQAVNGIATFDFLVLNQAGTYTLTATDTDGSTVLTSPTNATPFTITHGAADHLAFATQPSSVAEGANFGPVVVDVDDAFGNLVTNNASSVTLGIASGGPAGASITGSTTIAASAGVATFNNLSLADAGTYTLSATSGAMNAVSHQFTISGAGGTVGNAAKLVFATQPVDTTAGATMSGISVDVEDASGNLVLADGSTVTLSIATGPTGAAIDGTATAVVSNGVATFNNLIFDTAGTYTLSATDTDGGTTLTPATSNSFTVSPNTTASSLNITNNPTVSPGNPTSVNTALEDQFGNVETGDNSSQVILHVLNPDGTTTTLGPVTVTNGVATFNLSLTNPGNYSFNASSGSLTVNTGNSPITLTYTTPTLVFAQPIGTVIAGKKLAPFNVTLFNASGVVTNAKTKVTLALLSAPTGAKIYGSSHANMKNGTVTFKNIYFKVAGTYQLAANAPTFGTGTSTIFQVIPAAPKKLSFVQQPTPNPVAHGNAFGAQVKVVDAYGNGISGQTVTLSLKSHPKNATVPSGVLSEASVDGIADFTDLSLAVAGNYTLNAADGKIKTVSKKFVVT